ncbi:glycosyl hydrolases family 38 N-terminal domain-containing protein [Globomyces pollinis-pini]|nr:glycosyl hydrolases family 38 N-terminal domain-containing protein [Globomyces pollinis-pini]
MLKHRNITVERIQNYLKSDQFFDVNLQSFLIKQTSEVAVKLAKYSVPGLERIPFNKAMLGNYEPVKVGVQMSPTWSTHWFKVEIVVPTSMKGENVMLLFDPSCEALIWSDHGEPLMGITGGNGGDRHVDFDLIKNAIGGDKINLWIEVAANGMFGAGVPTMIGAPDPNRSFTLAKAELVVADELAQALYWDLEVLLGIIKEMPEESQLGRDALYTANQVVNTVRAGDHSTLAAAKSISTAFFATRKKEGYESHVITATGNCHIDTAWLWPYDETKRKVARSWATQCRFIESYPDYYFAASQAQQFEWLETLYPQLFAKVAKLTQEGRFIPIGGTWVEMDCNMPSGEGLCRQFLYGQNYFKKKFGKKSSVFWLPDTFGYAAQLPQIIKSAGLEYFFTQKLSWNNINKFPHSTFYWKGLDGTQVLTHFSPADTYTAQATVKDVVFAVQNNKDKQYSNQSLLLYGNGDGGGGPLQPMMERIRRVSGVEGLPATVKFGNPEDFYRDLEKTSKDLNVWKGELYFELHRGTYTSQALVKKYNRTSELLLREVEILWSFCLVKDPSARYPKEELDRLWKLTLLNQFHDVLPGSSIEYAYEDVIKFYEDVSKTGNALKLKALEILNIQGLNGKVLNCVNTLGWIRRNEIVAVPAEDPSQFAQITADNNGLVLISELGAYSSSKASLTQKAVQSVTVQQNEDVFVVENGFIKASFDKHGHLVQLTDIINNRLVSHPDRAANVFKIHEDIPLFWDAWDVEIYHLEKKWDAGVGEIFIEETGPLRVVLRVVHPISENSRLDQRIIINANSPQINFENDIWWNESRKILKVDFPVNITNDFATFETQFGYIQRPTHYNNSWDMAKFEVCAHKFVDYSEYGYGIALLNDCKYGFSVHNDTISMSILRSPKAPDAHCDKGRHTFKYALLPHAGSFLESRVVQAGYEFNVPILNAYGNTMVDLKPLFQIDQDCLVIDTIKRSEEQLTSNYFLIRIYEAYGGRGQATLSCGYKILEAFESNVLEDRVKPIEIKNSSFISFGYTPFKLISLLVKISA